MFASKVTTSKINEIKIYILSNIKAFWTSIIKKKKKKLNRFREMNTIE